VWHATSIGRMYELGASPRCTGGPAFILTHHLISRLIVLLVILQEDESIVEAFMPDALHPSPVGQASPGSSTPTRTHIHARVPTTRVCMHPLINGVHICQCLLSAHHAVMSQVGTRQRGQAVGAEGRRALMGRRTGHSTVL
jgi:hypothetical protein